MFRLCRIAGFAGRLINRNRWLLYCAHGHAQYYDDDDNICDHRRGTPTSQMTVVYIIIIIRKHTHTHTPTRVYIILFIMCIYDREGVLFIAQSLCLRDYNCCGGGRFRRTHIINIYKILYYYCTPTIIVLSRKINGLQMTIISLMRLYLYTRINIMDSSVIIIIHTIELYCSKSIKRQVYCDETA